MRQVFGGLLLAVGILIAGLSGLCMAFGFGSVLLDPGSSNEMAGILPMILIVGGIPFAIGVGLFFAGRALLRRPEGAAYPQPTGSPAAPLDPATMAHPDPDREDRP